MKVLSLAKSKVSTLALFGLLTLMIAFNGGAANAQTPTPPPPSYSLQTFASTAETKVYENLGVIMPVFIGIFLTMLGISMAKKWFTRGAKQS